MFEEKRICKICLKNELTLYKRFNKKKKSITEFYRPYCETCRIKKGRKISWNWNKDWIEFHHVKLNKSIEDMSKEFNVKESHLRWFLKLENVKEIKRCRICKQIKEFKSRPIGNQFSEAKDVELKTCIDCYNNIITLSAEKISKTKSNFTQEKIDEIKEKCNQHYINDSNKKKLEMKKRSETFKNNPDILIQSGKKCSITKANWTEEQYNQRVSKFLNTMQSKPKEEYDAWKEKMSFACIGKDSQKFFEMLEDELIKRNIKLDKLQYGKVDRVNKKLLQAEKHIDISSLGKDMKWRKLDGYVEYNKKKFCIEFDEVGHKYGKEQDAIREQDILQIVPDMVFYRVDQENFLDDMYATVDNTIEFILNF